MTSVLRAVAVVLQKELRVEYRSKELWLTALFLGTTLVVVFSFAFPATALRVEMAVPAVLWVSLSFVATIAMSRGFDRERENETMRALLLAPVPRAAIFWGKLLSIWLFLLAMGSVLLLVCALLFDVAWSWGVAMSLMLGTLGMSAVGVVIAGMLLRSQARDMLLPVVLFPLWIPLLLAATRAGSVALSGGAHEILRYWLGFLAAYDVLFTVAALWLFESLVIE